MTELVGTINRPIYLVPPDTSAGKLIFMQLSEDGYWINVYHTYEEDHHWQFKFPINFVSSMVNNFNDEISHPT